MSSQETPLCFECNGEALVGIAHVPSQPQSRGILMIIAGGPQYRAGVGRQLVAIARTLAEQGIPVMRFDYRGTGDSSGKHLGFEDMSDDLDAAIKAFMLAAPSVSEVVLWGGCNAASVALMDGPNNPYVSGMIISNPWVHSETTQHIAARHYYLQRLRQKSFWLKLFGFKMNPFKTFRSAVSESKAKTPNKIQPTKLKKSRPFQERMLEGAQKFNGKILLLVSGQSVVSREFDALVSSSRAWKKALKRPGVTRVDFSDANQTFSTLEARNSLVSTAVDWLEKWNLSQTANISATRNDNKPTFLE